MKIRQASRPRFFCLIAALAALTLHGDAHTAPAVLQCTVAALSSLGVRDITIVSATEVPAAPPNPSYCDVRGSVTTRGDGAADGSAGFEIKLPANWNDKFLFLGVGGLAGSLNPEANGSDVAQSLIKGYATAITDTGHQAFVLDGSWALEYLESISHAGHRQPGLILLDLAMPNLDGWQFLEERAKHQLLKNVPVVIISATPETLQPPDVCASVRKPMRLDALLEVIEREISR